MFEKVNPMHPDKLADRIAGAMVDLAYAKEEEPRIAVEVLLGHGTCHIIAESSVYITQDEVEEIVKRIAGNVCVDYEIVAQDIHLAGNQEEKIRCGDNGIFKGCPVTPEQRNLTEIAKALYKHYPYDGKYILDGNRLIICQSNADTHDIKESFSNRKIKDIRVSDAKIFLIKMQEEDGRSYSSIHCIRGVLRPAFQMAVDDDVLIKNPFNFMLASVIVNDSVTRDAISKKQMKRFLEYIKDNKYYSKYYDAVYILFHTGMRISEFCGLTLSDIDFEENTINIDHQLLRYSDMTVQIQKTKTTAGKRKIPMTPDVRERFESLVENRPKQRTEPMIDGYIGFLCFNQKGDPMVAMNWEHRFKHMVDSFNKLYREQLPKTTPHVCRHTYCSNMARAGMNPKTLQYLMGHSDIGVTLNTYTHLGLDDAVVEVARLKEEERIIREATNDEKGVLLKFEA